MLGLHVFILHLFSSFPQWNCRKISSVWFDIYLWYVHTRRVSKTDCFNDKDKAAPKRPRYSPLKLTTYLILIFIGTIKNFLWRIQRVWYLRFRDPLEIRLCIILTFATSWRLIAVLNSQHEQRYCRCCSSHLVELLRCTYISLYAIAKGRESARFFFLSRRDRSPPFSYQLNSIRERFAESTKDNLITRNRSPLKFHGCSRNFFRYNNTIR